MNLQIHSAKNGYIVENGDQRHVFNDAGDMIDHLRHEISNPQAPEMVERNKKPLFIPPWVYREGTD